MLTNMSSFDSSPKLKGGGLPPTKMEPGSRENWQSLLGKLLKTPQEVVVHTCVRETPRGADGEIVEGLARENAISPSYGGSLSQGWAGEPTE